jgi:GTP-binding protein
MTDDQRPFPADLAAGEALFSRPWSFLKSVPAIEFLPPADRPEIALVGRSNVGKSSLINALVRRRGLARTSNTPGRTQELNYFWSEGLALYLVDLPGYGFAEAPKPKVEQWTALVKSYLAGRPTLVRALLLIDARHGIKASDCGVMALLDQAGVAYQLVLTKADKISHHALQQILAATEAELVRHPAALPRAMATSSEKGDGIADLRAVIAAVARHHGARL